MSKLHNPFGTLQQFDSGDGTKGWFYSLPVLETAGIGPVSTLPVCLRLLLESVVRNCDGAQITEQHIRALANWKPTEVRAAEIPFKVSRVILQDFTGVPLLVDLAAMRSAMRRLGKDPKLVEPVVPVDLVIDHSLQVDFAGSPDAWRNNIEIEFARNRERYTFLKWATQAFANLRVIPPGIGIIHQVNLEYLAQGVLSREVQFDDAPVRLYYPDTLVGTDSHTTMINGLGILGWGVGGIEAEAAMLGQPIYFLIPDVIGVYLTGKLPEEATPTDLALTITQLLRKINVVGKFVEFFGPGAAALPVVDRAVVANMAPEYGATVGFFPIDNACVEYLRWTGRSDALCRLYENYYRAQGLWGTPDRDTIAYSQVVEFDLSNVRPCVAGPKRPQDRVELHQLKQAFISALRRPVCEGGYGKPESDLGKRVSVSGCKPAQFRTEWLDGTRKPTVEPSESEMRDQHPAPANITVQANTLRCELAHGSVIIAAITSCTNTSNPSLMLAAGLLAKKAVERGLTVSASVKTSLAPGSRVVTEYLNRTGLQAYLDKLGFSLVGYGCTTCIGNSGPLEAHIEQAVAQHDLVAVAVLSGNRNFEARVHPSIRANYLMSPPLVVAFALAGRIDIDLTTEPIGLGKDGKPVFLRDIWPNPAEIQQLLGAALDPEVYRRLYSNLSDQNPRWTELKPPAGLVYQWDPASTYIQEPPYFEQFAPEPGTIADIRRARCLAIFGGSITTDHISPAGAIPKDSPAARYLLERNVPPGDFNSFGARRGNHNVMIRGTFANVRIKNLMLGGAEGGYTIHHPSGQKMTIYDAAMRYAQTRTPLIVIAGQEYGAGSSRDWAAKGPALLGVKAVVAESFERIHRSNLVGMGVLPLQFHPGTNARTLRLDGSELYDVVGLGPDLKPHQELTLLIHRSTGAVERVGVICRLDSPIDVEYYRHGGILPYVLRQLLTRA